MQELPARGERGGACLRAALDVFAGRIVFRKAHGPGASGWQQHAAIAFHNGCRAVEQAASLAKVAMPSRLAATALVSRAAVLAREHRDGAGT